MKIDVEYSLETTMPTFLSTDESLSGFTFKYPRSSSNLTFLNEKLNINLKDLIYNLIIIEFLDNANALPVFHEDFKVIVWDRFQDDVFKTMKI